VHIVYLGEKTLIKSSYLDLRMRSQCLYLKALSNSYKIQQNNFRIVMQMEPKPITEDILQLTSPMIVVNLQIRNQSSLLSSLQTDVHQGLLSLNLKPSLKIDKKVKKNDKDDDREVDRTNAKLKLKKKTRSKINFEEDYDSVNDLLEKIDENENISLLPLARPNKPTNTDITPVSFVVKQKGQVSTNLKKKKSNPSSQKKELESSSLAKPSHINLAQPLTVQELSDLFSISKTDIIKSLFLKGIPVTVNQLIDTLTAQRLGEEFGIEVVLSSQESFTEKKPLDLTSASIENLASRSPIVTIMGHVDHGKTTLLDKIRRTQIAQKEAGGITQKIGAYEVFIHHKNEDRRIVFLDTPGHAAFSGMRSRGVSITDVAVLVVAADDGVKQQTIEAIKQIQASNVPIIVAINKIDKEDANVDNIKEELAKYNLVSEDWGGETLMVPISAMQGTNIDTLLEMILLVSDMLNLQADPDALSEGMIIESNLDRAKGAVASVLVQNGTLRVGNILQIGGNLAKVRGMVNSIGENIREAGPSSPVLIWGLSKVPAVGDTFASFKDEKDAKLFITANPGPNKTSTSSFTQLSENYAVSDSENKSRINIIVKTDTQGSAEAIVTSLNKINDSKVQIRILYSCAGEITETDVEFASTSSAALLAFNTTAASGALKSAKTLGVIIKEFNVIYDLFDFIQSLIDSLVGPQYEERFIGMALVKTVFPLAKSFVAGSFVQEGKITKSSFIHVIRDTGIIYKGLIDSLKKIKENVLEVAEDSECGIFVSEFDTWKQGDTIKAFELIPKKKSTL
jgi:translation initiation factor IF-2